jgi:hypothetical protein
MRIKRTKRCEQELSKECLWNEGLRTSDEGDAAFSLRMGATAILSIQGNR